MPHTQSTIGFIGGGNMAQALIRGLLRAHFPASNIWVSDPNEETRQFLKNVYNISCTECNTSLTSLCDILIFAVKPQIMKGVCSALSSVLRSDTLIISIAAGITMTQIHQWLHAPHQATIRAMPNTPALLGLGATGLFSSSSCSAAQQAVGEELFQGVGIIAWLKTEAELNAITALSGSGPAYHFLWLEAQIAAGIQLGLAPDVAKAFVLQTARGATEMAQQDIALETLRAQVTSKGGTTEAAIRVFLTEGLPAQVQAALSAAHARAEVLSTEQNE